MKTYQSSLLSVAAVALLSSCATPYQGPTGPDVALFGYVPPKAATLTALHIYDEGLSCDGARDLQQEPWKSKLLAGGFAPLAPERVATVYAGMFMPGRTCALAVSFWPRANVKYKLSYDTDASTCSVIVAEYDENGRASPVRLLKRDYRGGMSGPRCAQVAAADVPKGRVTQPRSGGVSMDDLKGLLPK